MYHSNNIAQQGNNRSGGPPGSGWVQRGGNQMMRGGRGRMNNRNMNNQVLVCEEIASEINANTPMLSSCDRTAIQAART